MEEELQEEHLIPEEHLLPEVQTGVHLVGVCVAEELVLVEAEAGDGVIHQEEGQTHLMEAQTTGLQTLLVKISKVPS